MKTQIKTPFAGQKVAVATLCMVCGLFFMLSGCEKTLEVTDVPYEVLEIPYFGYSVVGNPEGLHIEWSSELWRQQNDSALRIVNSSEELGKYLDKEVYAFCGIDYPDIDFARYTLLLAYSVTSTTAVEWYVNSLRQLSTNEYQLNVDVVVGNTFGIGFWSVALIVNKLNEESTVNLNVIIEGKL